VSDLVVTPRRTQAEEPPWKLVPLGDLCKTTSGGTPSRKRPDYFHGPIPWVKSGELTDGPVSEVEEFITEEALANSSAKVFPAGTLLIALYGATVGKLGVLTRDAATNQAICAIFPPQELDKRFLFWYLLHRRADLVARAVGGAQPNISQAILRGLDVPVPPIAQKRSVVAEIEKQFSRLDEAVANLKRVKVSLKRYRAAVLNDAVQGELVETQAAIAGREGYDYEAGDQLLRRVLEARRLARKSTGRTKEPIEPELTQLPDLPDGWVWASIDQLAAAEASAITDGPFGSNLKSEHYVSTGPRVIRLQNIKDGEFADEYAHISSEHFSKLRKHEVFAGDLVIASLGENPPRSCVIPSYVGPAIVKADCIRFKAHPCVSAEYLNIALNCQPTRARVKDVLHGIGRPRLSLGEIRAIALPLPPEAEQHRIVAEVDRRLSIVREVEAEVDSNLKRAQALRQAVLARAFGGDLSVQQASSPASCAA
jgi:type I restriction enzyme S subunit